MAEEKLTRVAIIASDQCKPKRCNLECKKSCPVVRMGKLCIEVSQSNKTAMLRENLCIGCGICVKKCPFHAISIINLPKNLEKDTSHRYGENSFKLHRLPTPRRGQVLGLIGTNGIGKSTALKILAGKILCNLGMHRCPPNERKILEHFRGSELHGYLTKLFKNQLKTRIKPQYVDMIPKFLKGNVRQNLQEKNVSAEIASALELDQLMDRSIVQLSGGELQRFAVAMTSVQDADILMYDEPTSYLDVRQRLHVAQVIRSMLHTSHDVYVIVVEHDLAILDYLSDFICCLYGTPGVYGVVTMPFSVRVGINIFLDGFIPTENLRFRNENLTFRVANTDMDEKSKQHQEYCYPNMRKTLTSTLGDTFTLNVQSGKFSDNEIIVLLGQNGTGKTTFVKLLAGKLQANDGVKVPELCVSYKPQEISQSWQGSVKQFLDKKISVALGHPEFQTNVVKPLKIEQLFDQQVMNLSGGELQRVAIVLTLGQPADVYLIDEPSAYLDSEQRIITARVIRRFILNSKKTAFIVEHDFIMATYMADRVIIYDGKPSIECTAYSPTSLIAGMNMFLQQLDVSFRRDPDNFRPRINKLDSIKDKEQKSVGRYFFMD